MKKLLANGEMSSSTYTGPGEILYAPPALGDITTLRLTGKESQPWFVGKDSWLCCTQGVTKDYKSQGIGKAMFSGEGLWVAKISGTGILWIGSFGAIIRKDVSEASLEALFTASADRQYRRWSRVKNTSLTTDIL